MFKIQFRVQKKIYEIIYTDNIYDVTVTLWNIKENKYINMTHYYSQNYSQNYTKYKNIFNNTIFPVNYSGKIIHKPYNKYITSLLNGKLHGSEFEFENSQLLKIHKYYMGGYNSIIIFYMGLLINNFSSNRIFIFTECGKLEIFSNSLKKMQFKFYLNGKIKSFYLNDKPFYLNDKPLKISNKFYDNYF